MPLAKLEQQLTEALDSGVCSLHSLTGGCVGEVYRAELDGGETVVVKVDRGKHPKLDIEASMLRYLATHSEIPVPEVIYGAPQLLVMQYIEHDGQPGPDVEIEAADALAALHNVTAKSYGFDDDTLIGGLELPNPRSENWPEFFADHRLRDMANRAVEAEMLDIATCRRVHGLADNLEQFIPSPATPSLIHGDIWGGNVLINQGHLAAFIDPAIYFADPEIELAFIDLFNTFGERFYARYSEHRPIDDAFFTRRKDLYNIFPLLVHVRLFGGSYVHSVQATLRKFGY